MLLSREIRFALVENYVDTVGNSWSGWPSTIAIAPHYRLQCVIDGQPNETGYICNIKDLDVLLRAAVTAQIREGFDQLTIFQLLARLQHRCRDSWEHTAKIVKLTLAVSPFLRLTIYSQDESMIELTQQFEFSAAHRLHCDHLSDEENVATFGKCNNPEGHGHNYVVEVSVAGRCGEDGQLIELHRFESIVKQHVIDRLDHKHLNRDVEHFQKINPSVENIAQAIFDWLQDKFGEARLNRVRVYETPKTWAQCDGAKND